MEYVILQSSDDAEAFEIYKFADIRIYDRQKQAGCIIVGELEMFRDGTLPVGKYVRQKEEETE